MLFKDNFHTSVVEVEYGLLISLFKFYLGLFQISTCHLEQFLQICWRSCLYIYIYIYIYANLV